MNAIEQDATAYAEREFARFDDPALSDIECWESFLGIDDAETRAEFDRRLVLKRAGLNVEPLFNENDRADAEAVAKTVYAEFAADQRNPAPVAVDDPDGDKLKAIIVAEAFSRAALRSYFYRQRRDALRAEESEREREQQREQQRERERRDRLAIPVVLEGELLPAPRPRSR